MGASIRGAHRLNGLLATAGSRPSGALPLSASIGRRVRVVAAAHGVGVADLTVTTVDRDFAATKVGDDVAGTVNRVGLGRQVR